MSDAEDHPESTTDEIKPINFEWTPELVKIGTSRGAIHPSIDPVKYENGLPNYKPDMTLPDPADTRECLKWVGLSDKKIVEVERKFNDLYPDYQGPSCGYDEKHHRTGYNEITFAKIDKMLKIFIQGMHDDHDEFEYTHKGYIEKGIQLGLRPEFAIFCGLHEDDPRAIEDPRPFEENWFDLGPADIMAAKLVHEGKAWEEAKEQATKEYEAEWELERQEHERLIAEEDARFAEEARQEAKMLKQQSIDKAVMQKHEEGTQ
ncbi:hypothetical protein N7471_008385 [Penicillium samsonianum]|uniref:uncharacterized protein n=1 Tax=Penicillium samsonianum TaxID=1882272 RepID=UPI002548735D|nr:uncharacterized protein N7471_008385 [Penicillium samsonianum]KAJ6133170.1 hypothetical protein N7471_008385 [Penicillium samsonianum]